MDFTPLRQILESSGIAPALRETCQGKTECYLVGGALRDFLLGLPLNDFDFCFPVNPEPYAKQIAEQLGATCFALDAERGHFRIVFKQGSQRFVCDFAPFRAPSLESDLRKRDLTINALALSCLESEPVLIDPLGGADDLSARRIRACSEYSFQEDPLRCLKAIRHAACFDMGFDPQTLQALTDAVGQIDQIASERIRTELAKAIGSKRPDMAFALLHQTGLLKELFGSAGDEAVDAAFELAKQIDQICHALRTGVCGQTVTDYLEDSCEENLSVLTALRMAAFFSGYRPVALLSVLQALRFSKRTSTMITHLQKLGAELLFGLEAIADTRRSRARWLAGQSAEPLATAIFIPLLARANGGEALLQAELLIDSYTACASNGKLPELVDGSWLCEQFGVEEGPQVGELLRQLHEGELAGEVNNVDEAQKWLLARQKVVDKDFPATL